MTEEALTVWRTAECIQGFHIACREGPALNVRCFCECHIRPNVSRETCAAGNHAACPGRFPMHTRTDTVYLCDCPCHETR